jgi:hypothetical protein
MRVLITDDRYFTPFSPPHLSITKPASRSSLVTPFLRLVYFYPALAVKKGRLSPPPLHAVKF